jgi:DNA polymerase III epsilon subunit-like protein
MEQAMQSQMERPQPVPIKEITIMSFDTETNDLPNNDRTPGHLHPDNWPFMLSYAYQIRKYLVYSDGYVSPGISVKTVSALVNNGPVDIHPKASAVNQLSNAMLEKHGYPYYLLHDSMANDFRRVDFIIAHNANFDLNVYLAQRVRHEGKLHETFVSDIMKRVICTAESTRTICQISKPEGYDDSARGDNPNEAYKRPKLTELFKHMFGADLMQSHDAVDDALVLDRIVQQLFIKRMFNAETLKL